MNYRTYQTDFYNQYDLLQDDESRLQKAKKIIASLSILNNDLKSLQCLDLGCSSGVITTALKPYFNKMVGLDFDPTGINAITEQNKEDSLFIRGDAMLLPFSDDSFDAIICAQVYEHVPDDKILFIEMLRIIKPNGIIFFSGPNKMFPIEPHYKLPFIHWLPLSWADKYLRIFNKGVYFDIRSKTYNNLKKQLINYNIYDMTRPLLRDQFPNKKVLISFIIKTMLKLPEFFWRVIILPLVPNINWVLINPKNQFEKGSYNVMD